MLHGILDIVGFDEYKFLVAKLKDILNFITHHQIGEASLCTFRNQPKAVGALILTLNHSKVRFFAVDTKCVCESPYFIVS